MAAQSPRALLLSALALWLAACGNDEKKTLIEPPAAHGVAMADEGNLAVYVGPDGVTVMGGQPAYTDEQILSRAEDFHERYPQGKVVVASHASALHGRTVRVLDLLKEAKIQRLALDVVPSSPDTARSGRATPDNEVPAVDVARLNP